MEEKESTRLKLAVVNWLAIYPTITLLLFILEPHINSLLLPFKTFVLTVIVVPIMTFIAVPLIKALIYRFKKLKG